MRHFDTDGVARQFRHWQRYASMDSSCNTCNAMSKATLIFGADDAQEPRFSCADQHRHPVQFLHGFKRQPRKEKEDKPPFSHRRMNCQECQALSQAIIKSTASSKSNHPASRDPVTGRLLTRMAN